MDMFFEFMESNHNLCNYLSDIDLGIYEIYSLTLDYIFTHKNMMFRCNPLRLSSSRNNKWRGVSSCNVDTLHDDNSFHTCVLNNSEFFHIFFHIGKLVFTHCTLPFWNFCHINNLQLNLNANMADIFLYDMVLDRDENRMLLFYDHKFVHMNEVKHLFSIQGSRIYHNSNNTLEGVHGTKTCTEDNSN